MTTSVWLHLLKLSHQGTTSAISRLSDKQHVFSEFPITAYHEHHAGRHACARLSPPPSHTDRLFPPLLCLSRAARRRCRRRLSEGVLVRSMRQAVYAPKFPGEAQKAASGRDHVPRLWPRLLLQVDAGAPLGAFVVHPPQGSRQRDRPL